MSGKPVPGAGDVEINFEGETKVLKPSVRAIREISRGADGITGAIQRVQKLEFETITLCLAVGLDLTDHGLDGFEDRVFKEGVAKFTAPLITYLVRLSNGGRPISREADKTTENPSKT